jgi:integrase
LRRADLAKITWKAVDFESGKIRWYTSKGKKKRRLAVIRLTPQIRATLERIGKKDSVTILNTALGRPYAAPGAMGTCFGDAMRKAGLKGTLHGLRRFAATNMSRQGHSSRELAKWLGWAEADAEDMASIYVDDEQATDNG